MTGDELRAWRDRDGLSQAQLATLLKIDVMTVSRWERDVQAIPPYLELALAELKRRIADDPVAPSSAEYLRRVMQEQDLSHDQVIKRAERAGYKLSKTYLHTLLVGAATNPSLTSVHALATGLDRPAEEVFAAFDDVVKKPSRPRQPKKKSK